MTDPTRAPLLSRLRSHAAGFPRPFWLVIAGTFAYLAGYECGYPFESIYLNEKLGISLTAVGLIFGITQLGGLPVQVLGGAAADRLGRRLVLSVGIVSTMVLFLGLALAHSVPLVVVLIAVEAACGWALYQMATNAIVGDVTPAERRAEAYSLSRTAASAGIVVGPLIGGLLLRHDPSYRLPFFVGGAICGVFLVITLVWLPETRPATTAAHASVRATLAGYREVLRDRRLVIYSAVTLLPLYCHGQFLMTFPILLKDTVGVSPSTVGLLYSLYALVNVVVQYPLVRRLRRVDPLKALAAASTCMGAGLAGAAFAPRGVGTALGVVVVSFGTALLMPISVTVISHLAPVRLRGRYMGEWTMVWTAGAALGPIFGGYAMQRLGGRGAYAIVLAAGLAGAVLYLVMARRRVLDPDAAT